MAKLRLSSRRKALLALIVLMLAGVAWLHFTGAAGISGMETREMDWNGDGTVTQQEILQAFHAVSVTRTQEGARTCRAYQWRRDGRPIRVDCVTEVAEESSSPAE